MNIQCPHCGGVISLLVDKAEIKKIRGEKKSLLLHVKKEKEQALIIGLLRSIKDPIGITILSRRLKGEGGLSQSHSWKIIKKLKAQGILIPWESGGYKIVLPALPDDEIRG